MTVEGDVDAETVIPSTSSIAAAKQKRERLRAGTNVEEDFISLSVSKRSDVPQGPHPESRLMREEDELGDADDGELCAFGHDSVARRVI